MTAMSIELTGATSGAVMPAPAGFLGPGGAANAPVRIETPAASADEARLDFADDRAGFLKFLAQGSLLQLLTLGIYRFWFKTDLRRWLWRSVRLGGDHLEYTGTGRELLIGFLVALTITVPLNIIAFGSSLGLEFIHPFLSTATILVFLYFGEFARFRARRYRLTRTVFRGVRFWMDGSAWSYANRAFLWMLLTVASLGLALPWMLAALERYKMRHSHYGSLPGGFVGTGGQLFRSIGWLWVLGLAIFATVFTLTIPAVSGFGRTAMDYVLGVMAGVAAAGGVLALFYPLIVTAIRRWTLNGMRFGEVSFRSDLSALEVFATYALNLLVFSIYFVLAATLLAVIGVGLANLLGIDWRLGLRQFERDLTLWPAWGVATYMALGYLVIFVVQGIITLFFLGRNLWKLTARSTTVVGLSALDSVEARGEAASSLGEGLADALDAGGI